MAYSESLALRIRHVLTGRRGVVEKKMFGRAGFLLNGNMCVGIWKQSLIVRLSAEAGEAALQEPNVVAFDITGRPMKGWIMVEPDGMETEEQLHKWVGRAVEFVETLPRK